MIGWISGLDEAHIADFGQKDLTLSTIMVICLAAVLFGTKEWWFCIFQVIL